MKQQIKQQIEQQIVQSISTLQAVLADERIASTVAEIAVLTANAMRAGNKLMVAGNGGSAADAQHLVAEFVVRLSKNRPALPAIALTTDSSILTACGNDFGFEQIFARQIEALGRPGDVFLGISTSGNSHNIVCALRSARERGVTTIGFSGSGGGQMRKLCDHNVIIPSEVTMNIQEAHLALEHIFCMMVERSLFAEDFARDA